MNIIVVGAGVVGCAIAHELASRGARVRVLDPRGTGQGATRASAGMLAPYIEGHSSALLALSLRSLGSYDDFIRRVEADSGLPIEYERRGTLQVALDAAESRNLCVAARALDEQQVECSLLDAAEARRLEPALSPQVTSALLVPTHGYVAASALTTALAQAATRLGAVLSTERVLTVSGSGRPRVTTADGASEADAVIVAAGSWSPQVMAAADDDGAASRSAVPGPAQTLPVKPIRGQIVRVGLADRPVSRVLWGSRCYMVPWRSGSVLIGATSEDVGFDEGTTEAGVEGLLDAGRQLVPVLEHAVLEDVRAGLRPMTPDELPLIGRSSTMPGVFYATGHYRNGVLLSPLTASLVADLVLEGRESPELALVRPDRLGM